MARLTAKSRRGLATSEFAGPARSYPIEDASHARNALSRVSANGSPALKARVRAKVHAKYPSIGSGEGGAQDGSRHHHFAHGHPNPRAKGVT